MGEESHVVSRRGEVTFAWLHYYGKGSIEVVILEGWYRKGDMEVVIFEWYYWKGGIGWVVLKW